MKGFGGMVSFQIDGGADTVNSFLRNLRVFSLAESLGGVDSLAEHPATMSHASMPESFRKRVGITDDLIRLSVGLENADDLSRIWSRRSSGPEGVKSVLCQSLAMPEMRA